jgi:hypothetical protein
MPWFPQRRSPNPAARRPPRPGTGGIVDVTSRFTLIASAIALSLLGFGSVTRAQVTDDESKCQLGTSLAVGKFVSDKSKCITKCEQGAAQGR